MRADVKMPRMGQSMEEGVILRWLKAIGDWVTRGEALVEIETDKATVDIQCFVTGTLVEILAEAGTTVSVGATIAVIEEKQTASTVALAASPPPTAAPTRVKPVRPNASPLAKRLAQEHGINLLEVKGTGPGGRIGKDDLRPWMKAAPVVVEPVSAPPAESISTGAAPRVTRVPLSKIKQIAARRMSASKAAAPHFYVSMDIDMGRTLDLRESLKARGHTISINDLILKAVALTLVDFPNLNATFDGDAVQHYSDVNLSIAVALGESVSEGLVTPVVTQCQKRTLLEISTGARAAVERARAGRLNSEDVEGGTFTVSNLGMFGVKAFTAIINPPQAAILAVGSVRRIPVFDAQDRVIAAHIMTVTLSVDHRVSDGAEAARFLAALKSYLENPFSLVSVF